MQLLNGWSIRFQAFIKELRSLAWSALVQFIWADLSEGLIDLRQLSRPTRALVGLGFAVTLLCLALLTQAPALRAHFPLYTSVTPALGRGLHIPIVIYPLSIFLLALAWAYLLTGARHCAWFIRLGIFLLYSISISGWLSIIIGTNLIAVAGASLLYTFVLLSYLWPRLHRLSFPVYFAFVLICVSSTFAVVQSPLLQQEQASGLPIGKTLVESNLRSLATAVIPLLILIGLDIADFSVHTSQWLQHAAARVLPAPLLASGALTLLVWLGWQGGVYVMGQSASGGIFSTLPSIGGTIGLLLLLWLAWGILTRFFPPADGIDLDNFGAATGRIAVAFVVAFLLPLLISYLILEIAQSLQNIALVLQSGSYGNYPKFIHVASTFYRVAGNFSATASRYQIQWQVLCAIGAIIAAQILARRGHYAGALYALTAGVNYLWVEVTRPGHLLQKLVWTSPEALVGAWVLCLLVWTVVTVWRRRFSASWFQRLLLLTLLLSLLRQTNLIASPLAPLFSLAGVAYLAAGLGWDLLTAGSWANVDTKALPRTNRIFLYLGYVILTAMLVNWAVAAHDFTLLDRFTGEAGVIGLRLIGYPYLFCVIYLLMTNQPGSDTEDDALEPSSQL